MGGKNLTRVFLLSCWLILGAGDGAAGPPAGGAAKIWEKETEALVLSRWGRFEAWRSAPKQQKPI